MKPVGGVLLLSLLITLPLAGCLSGEQRPAGDDRMTVPTVLAHEASGCQEIIVAVLAELDHLADQLPSGFTPADAQALLGTPAPVGRGAVIIDAYHCQASSFGPGDLVGGEVSVLVDAPRVAAELPSADLNSYQIMAFTEPGAYQEMLAQAGWPQATAAVGLAVEQPMPDGPAQALAFANVDEQQVFSLNAAGAAPTLFSGVSRIWHATPGGLAMLDFTVDTEAMAGAATCQLAQGSAPATTAGRTMCTADAVGLIAPGFGFTVTWRYLEGVQAG